MKPTATIAPPRLADSSPWNEALREVAAEMPPAEQLAAIDTAVAAGLAKATTTTAAVASGGAAAFKSAVVGLTVMAAIGGGAVVISQQTTPPPPAVEALEPAVPQVPEAAPPAMAPADEPDVTPAPQPAPAPQRRPEKPTPTPATLLPQQAKLLATARRAFEGGRYGDARVQLETLQHAHPDSPLRPEAQLLLAQILRAEGAHGEALAVAEPLLTDPALAGKRAELWRLIGDLHLAGGACEATRAAYLKALALGLPAGERSAVRANMAACSP